MQKQIYLALLIGAGLVNSAMADTERDRCRNVASLAVTFATHRDNGVSIPEINDHIKRVAKAGDLTPDDVIVMSGVAAMVYYDLKNKSPEQIRRSFLAQCKR